MRIWRAARCARAGKGCGALRVLTRDARCVRGRSGVSRGLAGGALRIRFGSGGGPARRGGVVSERRADALRDVANLKRQSAHAKIVHVLGSARDTDRGRDAAVDASDGRGNATDSILVLLEIEGVPHGRVFAHAGEPRFQRHVVSGAQASLVVVILAPLLLVGVEDERLAETCGAQRLALADPGAHFHPAATLNLVE